MVLKHSPTALAVAVLCGSILLSACSKHESAHEPAPAVPAADLAAPVAIENIPVAPSVNTLPLSTTNAQPATATPKSKVVVPIEDTQEPVAIDGVKKK
jgi:hypothetical protein